jgi:hypothetical protein
MILDSINNNSFSFVSELTKINVFDKNYLELILFYSNDDEYILSLNSKIIKVDKE